VAGLYDSDPDRVSLAGLNPILGANTSNSARPSVVNPLNLWVENDERPSVDLEGGNKVISHKDSDINRRKSAIAALSDDTEDDSNDSLSKSIGYELNGKKLSLGAFATTNGAKSTTNVLKSRCSSTESVDNVDVVDTIMTLQQNQWDSNSDLNTSNHTDDKINKTSMKNTNSASNNNRVSFALKDKSDGRNSESVGKETSDLAAKLVEVFNARISKSRSQREESRRVRSDSIISCTYKCSKYLKFQHSLVVGVVATRKTPRD